VLKAASLSFYWGFKSKAGDADVWDHSLEHQTAAGHNSLISGRYLVSFTVLWEAASLFQHDVVARLAPGLKIFFLSVGMEDPSPYVVTGAESFFP